MIRAKFRVQNVVRSIGPNGEAEYDVVTLHPVTTGSEENKQWSQYTPSGEIKMHITAQGAVDKFRPGQQYYVDFTQVEK